MSAPTTRNVQTLARSVALTLGAGYLILVAAPVTAVTALLVGSGYRTAGVALLGLTLVATAACLTAVGLAWVLAGTLVSVLDATQAAGRLRLLRWAETAETTRPWARLVRPSARLAVIDPRSAEERTEDDLARLKTRYVSGALSTAEFERELNHLLGTKSPGRSPDDETVSVASVGARRDPVESIDVEAVETHS